MTFRARTLTTFRAADEASNRFQEHVKEVLNPVLKSFGASLRWIGVGGPGGPAFGSGWTHFGAPFAPVSFAKDALGIVHLRGLAQNAAGVAAGSVIFTLPDGYKPSAEARFTSAGEGSPSLHTLVDVMSDGRVVATLAVAAGGYRSLDGMTFEAAP